MPVREFALEVLQRGGHFDKETTSALLAQVGDDDESRRQLRELLELHADRFDDDARDVLRGYLETRGRKMSRLDRVIDGVMASKGYIAQSLGAMGTIARTVFGTGLPKAADIAKVRDAARALNVHGTGTFVRIEPDAGAEAVYDALRRATDAIDAFSFLAWPPAGAGANRHVVLIKPGINWGKNGYPTVTSWESVYAMARLTLEAADRHGAEAEVLVAEETGAACKMWGASTLDNMEMTGILHGAVRAGLERAGKHVPERVTLADDESIGASAAAGVRVMGLENDTYVRVPVPHARHFVDGVLTARTVAEDVTDIINLCKPPGRHLALGNNGVTGGIKNYVGLLGAADRVPGLHGPYARYPARYDGEEGDAYVDRLNAYMARARREGVGTVAKEFFHGTKREGHQAEGPFQEKLVEIYLAHRDKERFVASDMRKTLGTMGPDFGDVVEIGAVLAAKDPATLDLLGAAFLKCAYDRMGSSFLKALKPGGDQTLNEYVWGRNFLKGRTAFDLTLHVAANSYGVGPVDLDHLDLVGVGDSGFSEEEIEALHAYWRA